MEFHKELILIVTDLFLREKKLKISLVFIGRSYFKVPNKNYKLNATHYFIMNIPNKLELQKELQVIHLTLTLKIS